MLKLKSFKTQLILFLAVLAIFLSVKDKDAVFLSALIIAVISSLIIESIILFLKKNVFEITESSNITGLIIGFVLSSNIAWGVIIAASLIAVFSKHLIRFKNKHIFNPAAFGIFLSCFLFNVSTQWKGAYSWYLLLPAGFYFIYKIRKIEIITSCAVVFVCLFAAQALWQKNSIWHIFGYINYFFIFIMMIEPRTTPVKPAAKLVFGAGVSVLIFILTQSPGRFDTELLSLLIMNAAILLLERIPHPAVFIKNS
ncbi:MAG: RnfABCDGE type electron transport complex subunit D [Candidatus Omnitrophica bacterium]|nr:RnfABCDGE type electron transport complex subunit D [Candidatus Omnitrophota bacterium]